MNAYNIYSCCITRTLMKYIIDYIDRHGLFQLVIKETITVSFSAEDTIF